MLSQICLHVTLLLTIINAQLLSCVSGTGAPGDTVVLGSRYTEQANQHAAIPASVSSVASSSSVSHVSTAAAGGGGGGGNAQHTAISPSPSTHALYNAASAGSGHVEHRSSYNLLSEAMSQAVSNEFSSGSGSADGACHVDDLECFTLQDRLGMEAIRSLHRQLDDDDNGNIDLSESDDFLREELKYDSGYEKRQKAFHFNDDMHISVKELWEAWLRSEVHNWTIEQTTDWLAQSVQLPQYVELFKQHKVTGAALPRLAVNNMHYVGNVLGIKDPIHKQKIALKAMDVVLFGPPRETGTRWKDYILVTLLLSAIIGCWYAYQQNKNAKRHLRRMAQDMEGLQRAEQSLQEMQKELERARMEQKNVATEKMDLERRLKEAPALSSSSSDLEVQQLKKEIEMLRSELSRAEIELVDNCWTPPPQLQSWLQYTYELESKNHLKKRVSAEKQLQSAREACEKLRKKRSSLVGAFVSTHGKSIDDVDRSIVEARNSLGEVTNELQERLHRWKQIESCLGLNIVNNNGMSYLESVLYGRNNGTSTKGSRARITSSTDDLDDESVQGIMDNYSRNSLMGSNTGGASNSVNHTSNSCYNLREDSSGSEDNSGPYDNSSGVHFYLGGQSPTTPISVMPIPPPRALVNSLDSNTNNNSSNIHHQLDHISTPTSDTSMATATVFAQTPLTPLTAPALPLHTTALAQYPLNDSIADNGSRHSPSISSEHSERSIPVPPRTKKHQQKQLSQTSSSTDTTNSLNLATTNLAPIAPPRKSNQSEMLRSQSTDLLPMEIYGYHSRQPTVVVQQQQQQLQHEPKQHNTSREYFTLNAGTHASPQSFLIGSTSGGGSSASTGIGGGPKKMVKQLSNASQQSTSSTSSSVQSAPPTSLAANADNKGQSPGRWSSHERILCNAQHTLPIHHEQLSHEHPIYQQQQKQQQQQSKQQQFKQHHIGESFEQFKSSDPLAISLSLQSLGSYRNSTTAAAAAATRNPTSLAMGLASTTTTTTRDVNGIHGIITTTNATATTSTSAASSTPSHGNTAVADGIDGSESHNKRNHNSTSNGDDGNSIKKRKRRLRFPFSVGRKSGSNESSTTNSIKNKFH